MADETFEIGFQVSGEADAVKAFEDLKVAELQTKTEAAALAAELRKLQQSGTATADQIETAQRALVRAKEAASGYAREAREVQRAQQLSATSAAAQTRAMQAQTSIVTTAGQKWGQLGSALGNVGGVLGHISPQLGSVGQLIGQVGGASTALTGALGPVGVAFAAVTTAAGFLIPLLTDTSGEMGGVERGARGAAREIRNLVQEMSRQRELGRIAGGTASADEMQAVVQEATAQRDFIRQARQELTQEIEAAERRRSEVSTGGSFAQMRAAEERIERLRASIPSLDASLASAEASLTRFTSQQTGAVQRELEEAAAESRAQSEEDAEDERARRERRVSGHHDATDAILVRERQFYDELQRMREQDLERDARYLEDLMSGRGDVAARRRAEYRDLGQGILDDLNEENAAVKAAGNERHEHEMAQRDAAKEKRHAEYELIVAEQQRISDITNNMWSSLGGTVTDFAGQMAKFVISSSDKSGDAFLRMLDQFLEATAIEYSIKAIAEGANAAIAFASLNAPQGIAHLTAAGLAAGVAAATGIGAAAINVPSAPSGGSSAQPVQGAGSASGGGGMVQNLTVQLFAPQAVFTEAERGQLMASGIREARRQLGPGSART